MTLEKKPSEFYLRAYDLFAILVPGLVFVTIALMEAWDHWTLPAIGAIRGAEIKSEGWLLGFILLVGFVSGHIIEGIGSLLDDVEWRLVSRILGPESRLDRLLASSRQWRAIRSVVSTFVPIMREFGRQRQEICQDLQRAFPRRTINFQNARQWALVFLSKHASADIQYLIEQKDAQRKAVRNIAVLALLAFMCPSIRAHALSVSRAFYYSLPVLVIASWQRHSQLQWKYSNVVFDYFAAYYSEVVANSPKEN